MRLNSSPVRDEIFSDCTGIGGENTSNKHGVNTERKGNPSRLRLFTVGSFKRVSMIYGSPQGDNDRAWQLITILPKDLSWVCAWSSFSRSLGIQRLRGHGGA